MDSDAKADVDNTNDDGMGGYKSDSGRASMGNKKEVIDLDSDAEKAASDNGGSVIDVDEEGTSETDNEAEWELKELLKNLVRLTNNMSQHEDSSDPHVSTSTVNYVKLNPPPAPCQEA